MKRTCLLLLALPILITSCAPRVMTDIVKTYPTTTTAEQIRLYEVNDTVPNSAEVIGKVAVVDNGFSSNCKYDQIILLAKKETAKNGGNALALTKHFKPSIWGSSCHQIFGTMLNLKDTLIDTTIPNPFLEAREIQIEYEKKMRPTQHTIYANIGIGGISSKFYLPSNTSGNPKNGLDWQIGYEWISKRGLGIGLMYSGYKSSFDWYNDKCNVSLTYIGPEFVLKQKIHKKWQFRESLGFGYFGYRESMKGTSGTVSGVGFDFQVGLEYLLSQHVGIGLNFGYIGGSLPKQENNNTTSEDGRTGIFRMNGDAGIRFYF